MICKFDHNFSGFGLLAHFASSLLDEDRPRSVSTKEKPPFTSCALPDWYIII